MSKIKVFLRRITSAPVPSNVVAVAKWVSGIIPLVLVIWSYIEANRGHIENARFMLLCGLIWQIRHEQMKKSG